MTASAFSAKKKKVYRLRSLQPLVSHIQSLDDAMFQGHLIFDTDQPKLTQQIRLACMTGGHPETCNVAQLALATTKTLMPRFLGNNRSDKYKRYKTSHHDRLDVPLSMASKFNSSSESITSSKS
jgi:hypothetical protein